MSTLDEEMSQLFLEEANELLTDYEQALLLLESIPDDVELLNRVFRCAHTLKGNSKILGFQSIAEFTHELEDLLDRLRRRQLMMTRGVADTLLASFDVLKALVAEVAGGPAHDSALRAQVSLRIEALLAEIHASISAALAPRPADPLPLEFPASERPAAVVEQEPSGGLLGADSIRPANVPGTSESFRPGPRSLRPRMPSGLPRRPDSVPAGSKLKSVRVHLHAVPPGAPARHAERRANAGEPESNSVRVPIDKLDRLINLTGEVVIAQSMIAQLVMADLTPEHVRMLQEVVAQMERHCRELQERMLGARMLPIKTVFSRFNRLVRDLSASTGKTLSLELSGEDTELDKTVIERIADPLIHLVRNAIDHGVETTEERLAAGKSGHAVIKLVAYQSSGNIFIDVSDDGRGLNRAKILSKARTLGLVAADAQPSNDEIDALIFHPGFSTADQVTEISGRGVGMDVVKRNVETLRGSISIQTKPGEGTCFRIKLPLTMAILDGLGLRVGSEAYLVPLVAVVESLQPKKSDISQIADVGEVIDVRGEYLPLVRLYQLFGLTPTYPAAHEGLVMVIEDGERRIALQVDELLGQFQVVIKSLETNFTAVPGVAGATILGDGRVALILDTANLTNLARTRALSREVRSSQQLTGSDV
ncbi:MAG: cheA [Myxococcaceae bacterium]|nr:cheA [Myxococcaceae bacterium]